MDFRFSTELGPYLRGHTQCISRLKIKRKHIAILTSKQHLFSLIESSGKKIIEIEIPDNHLKSVHNYSSKISTLQHDIYVLLMFSSNHCDTSIEEQSKWTIEFAECIKKI